MMKEIFLEQSVFVPPAADDLCKKKQDPFGTAEVGKHKRAHDPQQWLLTHLLQGIVFQYSFLSNLTVFDFVIV